LPRVQKQEVDVPDELRAEQRLAIAPLPATAAYRPTMALIAASLAALISMAVCAAAILVPAPVGAVPVVVVICFVCPFWAAREVPSAIASRRAKRAREVALASLRASLERLPETEHPLGF
jgi:hypothetical protein